jgi:hypothetical protein
MPTRQGLQAPTRLIVAPVTRPIRVPFGVARLSRSKPPAGQVLDVPVVPADQHAATEGVGLSLSLSMARRSLSSARRAVAPMTGLRMSAWVVMSSACTRML